ncbi:hypothetical protein GOB93_14170 [Acetobacter musti]|uniref:Lipocalin-like domain-containing protein n=1 Tax=Acetobacter musti TaxID=864732 RepID=A0ABX0JWA8_9PROT|nr:hypothetical protein [Acetobacter musti]NHN85779.1 hypothetical protein [Acetobacter musti]
MKVPAGYTVAGALTGGEWVSLHRRKDGSPVTKTDIDTQRALRTIDLRIVQDGARALYCFKRKK